MFNPNATTWQYKKRDNDYGFNRGVSTGAGASSKVDTTPTILNNELQMGANNKTDSIGFTLLGNEDKQNGYNYNPSENPTYNPEESDSIFSRVDNPDMQADYENVVGDAMSGDLYDPTRSRISEAMARNEASARAANANYINRFGNSGMGRQLANKQESNIRKNRFDSLIGIDEAENRSRLAGANMALGYANAQDTSRLNNNRLDLSGAQFEEGQQQFDETMDYNYGRLDESVRQFDESMDENSRQFDTSTSINQGYLDLAKLKETNAKAAQELETAALYGSPEDFANAYEKAYGVKIDPSNIEHYQNLAKQQAEIGLDINRANLDSTTEANDQTAINNANSNFKDYVDTNRVNYSERLNSGETPEQIISSDPILNKNLQSIWESQGMEGQFDMEWAKDRFNAARMTPDEYSKDLFMSQYKTGTPEYAENEAFYDQVVAGGGWKQFYNIIIGDDGTYKFALKDEIGSTGDSTEDLNETDPQYKTKLESTEAGEIFVSDNKLYKKNVDGKAEELSDFDPDMEPWSSDADKIIERGKEDNPHYNLVQDARLNSLPKSPNVTLTTKSTGYHADDNAWYKTANGQKLSSDDVLELIKQKPSYIGKENVWTKIYNVNRENKRGDHNDIKYVKENLIGKVVVWEGKPYVVDSVVGIGKEKWDTKLYNPETGDYVKYRELGFTPMGSNRMEKK